MDWLVLIVLALMLISVCYAYLLAVSPLEDEDELRVEDL